jgi:hypothetical protein
MQKQLVEALCVLPDSFAADQAWLVSVWPSIPENWIKTFWDNDKGRRSIWIKSIAAASVADKQTIRRLLSEQLLFANLYHDSTTFRLTDHDWTPPVFAAVKNLLISFYAPLFYKNNGFPDKDGTLFHKDHFINPRPKICPYTDNIIQDPKLDHFLPKDRFPMLSCHPDNLIPCSSDSNSGGHKGNNIPLSLGESKQAENWFHPRWRSADGTYRLTFYAPSTAPEPKVQFVALNSIDQIRLNNLEAMFGLSDFWGGYLDDEVQNVSSDVSGWLSADKKPATANNVEKYLRMRAVQEGRRKGIDALSIPKSFYYDHIAQTPILLSQVVRSCQNKM